ncbi:MAG: GGDEF domain-containing protein [Hespellia sp.]|nr:GGDEF domain-containing protein [Hespellia sp.]
MKKEKGLISLGILLFVGFIVIAVLTFHQSNQKIEDGYLASEGNAAQNFAVLIAANIHLTNDEVNTLKNMSYTELQGSAQNYHLKKMTESLGATSKVDYAYVMMHLPEEDVKYEVTEENKSFFDAEIGTPLDILWLLDVTVNEEENADRELSKDDMLRRYSYYIPDDQVIFGEAPVYIFNKSEWGDHICGYAPIHSVEGDYIGVVGVELQTKDFDAYRTKAMSALAMLLGIATATLTSLFVLLYSKYRKLQYDKIYTDALTGIYNRSYYNNRLVRRLNQTRQEGYCLALMIADIDWFKKINDTFGHDVGDQALIEMGNILVETFGKENVIRFGGEEFVIGIWIKKEAELKLRLSELYKRIDSTKFCHQQIDVSISLGGSFLYCYEVSGWVLSGMLKAADYKLYECKEQGRRQFQLTEFDPEKDYEKK